MSTVEFLPMPETDEMFECRIFVDPIYGSERSIRFRANWVAEAEDRIFKLIFWRRRPVTFIRFSNNKHYLVEGHWAERIAAAQGTNDQAANDQARDEK